MREINKISANRQQLIDNVTNSIPNIGEMVYVENELVYGQYGGKGTVEGKVVNINPDKTFTIEVKEHNRSLKVVNLTRKQFVRNIRLVGANPFDEKFQRIQAVSYGLDSIIFTLDLDKREIKRDKPYSIDGVEIKESSFNPYVYDKDGNKQYYQRDLVWTLEDKQLLVESIYKGINCGLILIRNHSWDYLKKLVARGEKEISFRDVVDGKQRLNAVAEFINNEFPDKNGNYFDDLSAHAQWKFTNHQLFQYAELPEDTKDEEVIYQFLKLNFAGVPQSKEHIEFVENIGKLLK